jgi:outer membrane receptor protein involved in Fe transport
LGTAGNDGTAAYQWLSGFTYNSFFAINETAIPTIDNTSLANTDLTWETITTYDVGIDMELFNRNLSLSIDYFKRNKNGVLAYGSSSVPSTLGVGLAAQNFHEYSNEGFETSIN